MEGQQHFLGKRSVQGWNCPFMLAWKQDSFPMFAVSCCKMLCSVPSQRPIVRIILTNHNLDQVKADCELCSGECNSEFLGRIRGFLASCDRDWPMKIQMRPIKIEKHWHVIEIISQLILPLISSHHYGAPTVSWYKLVSCWLSRKLLFRWSGSRIQGALNMGLYKV